MRPGDVVFQLAAILADEVVGFLDDHQAAAAAEERHGGQRVEHVAERHVAAAGERGERELVLVAAQHLAAERGEHLALEKRLVADDGADRPGRILFRMRQRYVERGDDRRFRAGRIWP